MSPPRAAKKDQKPSAEPLADAIREREERYSAFIRNSSEGIWRLEFDPPIDISLPVEEQVDQAYRHGRLAECNQAMARMYGLERIEDLLGVGLEFMLPSSDPAAREYVASIIRAGYRVTDVESVERDAASQTRYFSNSMIGVVEDGLLRRMWGTQQDISERKQAEESLRESEQRFRLMADAAPVLIWVSGIDQGRTWFNRSWLEFVGRTPEQERGDGWTANIHPDDIVHCRDTYKSAFDAREPCVVEYRLRRSDGQYRWLLDHASPRQGPSGEFSGYIGSSLDITERRREGEERAYLAAIVDSSDDAIVSKDLNGIIQTCNAAAERVFGYPAAELIGQQVRMLIPPDRQQEEEEILARIRRGEKIDHFETVRVAKGGRLLDVSLTVSAVRNDAGVVVGASKVARDVTERRRAEAASSAQRAWFETTLESIADAVIATDIRGRVVFMNSVAEELTGWRAAAAVDCRSDQVFHVIREAGRHRVEDAVRRVLSQGEIIRVTDQVLLLAADGTERPIENSAAPIRNHEGRVVGVVLVFRDVTERRRLEAERAASNLERERLLEAERAARAEAERASRVKDDFVAMVSDELRTPLNAILGWTQLMSRASNDPILMARGLDVVARNTRLQAQLISDLLDISRIVAGKLRLEMESVDVRAVVNDAIETIDHEARLKEITIRRPAANQPATMAGDPARLQQIVWNLLSNALKFTPKGGEISVDLRSSQSATEIVVADNGAGIRPESLPHVFDRFHQADRSITRRFGGLGLGLSIVKHLAELHGGQVTAESGGEGLGATFTVTLPSSIATTLPAVETSGPLAERAGHAVILTGVRVLAVEDETDTLQFLKRLLESHGATVLTAASADEALRIFRAERPDVLISDIGLPVTDGYDLMQQIRRESVPGHRVAAIALTAYARAEDRTRALRAGFQAHIAKPVEAAELLAMVASFVELADLPRRTPSATHG